MLYIFWENYTFWRHYVINFLKQVNDLVKLVAEPIPEPITGGFTTAIGTGVGLVIANWITNILKYKNRVNDTSKVFDLLIRNQLDDIYNIRIDCIELKKTLKIRGQKIFGYYNAEKTEVYEPESRKEERKRLLKESTRIKNREDTIRNDDLYKNQLNNINLFKGIQLQSIVEYFRKLKILLEDLRNLTYYDLPNNLDEFEYVSVLNNDNYSESYDVLVEYILARIDITSYYGLIVRYQLNIFNKNQLNNDLNEVRERLKNSPDYVKNQDLLKEDFSNILDTDFENSINKNNY